MSHNQRNAGLGILAGLAGLALVTGAVAATAAGVPQTLPIHTPTMAAPVSVLPKARVLGAGAAYGGPPIDVTTYHYDTNRSGWNASETALTQASIASARFGVLATLPVDGNVFAQPLLVSGYVLPDNTAHDILVVATGHDSVYAFDANTFAVLWQVSLGHSQSSADVGCGDVHPEYGISSTPVIVRSGPGSATLYVVAATEPAPYQFHTTLHALSLSTGADVTAPVEIAPTATLSNGQKLTFDAQNQWSRAGVAYANNSVYVSIGSHCDNNAGAISGWELRYDGATLAAQNAFHTIQTPHGYELASIWMTGFAPAVDAAGNLYVVTGNGDYHDTQQDYGESILKLSPTLSDPPLGRYVAPDYQILNNGDVDFGSGGVMLLPKTAGQTAPQAAIAMGKEPVMYLVSTTMGTAPLVMAKRISTYSGVWGGPAYYNGPEGPTVFYQINGDVLRAFKAPATAPTLVATVKGTSGGGYGGSLPIVSSNGATPGTGVVWLIRRSNPPALEAYNADTLGAPIFAANLGAWSNPGQGNPFLTPLEANGRVYAPGYLSVTVFGLAP